MSDDLVMANTENGLPRSAELAPTQTLRTEGGLAFVMANRMNNVGRVAAAEPSPPILTGDTVAVVHMRGTVELQRHGDVRPASDPVHTVRAGGNHHAIVMRNNNSRGDQGHLSTPSREPVRALTTAGHQSVVIPFTRGSLPLVADREPTSTLTTRDRLALLVPPVVRSGDALPEPVEISDDELNEWRFRMFALDEIGGAMAMLRHPTGGRYDVKGNKREVMAQYGNSVTPPAMAWIIARLITAGYDASRIIDLFCGAGGSGTGARLGGGQLVLGLNHWKRAIETYGTNHPEAEVDCEDVSSLTTAQIRAYLRFARPTGMIGGPECTNHSIAKGGRRVKPQAASLWEDGPGGSDEQDKSRATMWDIVRFAEQAILLGQPLEFLVVENVVDAYRWGLNDDGGLFAAWLIAMDNLGYRHEIHWLNSMLAPPSPDPAPQSRDRMYVEFTLKTGPAPDLRLEPPAWCYACEKIVNGRQVWKRPDRPAWGRYGPQYLYACPDCWGFAVPGAYAADTIIDYTLPAEKIGERKKPLASATFARVRRGAERLASEPFAIRLLQSGAPKTLTLPLVTLTARHDMALVMPVAGNTFERTSGNRARRADSQPVDTVHGTLDRAVVLPVGGSWQSASTLSGQPVATQTGRESKALVIPPMGGVAPRPAATVPAPTQTTTTRAAVVFPASPER